MTDIWHWFVADICAPLGAVLTTTPILLGAATSAAALITNLVTKKRQRLPRVRASRR